MANDLNQIRNTLASLAKINKNRVVGRPDKGMPSDMKESKSNLAGSSRNEKTQCPMCDHDDVQTCIEENTFTYGIGPKAVKLTAFVPVLTCYACGFRYTDEIGEEIQHKAVCDHLGVMTPKEITDLRKRYGLSQKDFARLTKIGEASLARWEKGELIQNAANDNLLRLLISPKNMELYPI